MATKLNSGFSARTVNIAATLASKGRELHDGFLDEHDLSAMKEGAAIRVHSSAVRADRAFMLRKGLPIKQGQRKSTFGRPAFHPNRDAVNVALIG